MIQIVYFISLTGVLHLGQEYVTHATAGSVMVGGTQSPKKNSLPSGVLKS